MRNRETGPNAHARFWAVATALSTYLLLLAGQFTFERAGLEDPLPIPERAAAALLLVTLLAYPLAMARQSLREPARHPLLRPILLLLATLLLSAMWARPSPGLVDSVWDLVTMGACFWLLVRAMQISREAVVSTFTTASLVTGIVFAVAGLGASGPGNRIAAFGGGPNVFARITGMGFVAAIYFATREHGRRRGFLVALAPFLLAATVLSGSRGAMAGLVAAFLVFLIMIRPHARRRLLGWLVLATPLIAVVWVRYGALVSETIRLRIVRLTFEERETSGREPLISAAWNLFTERPFAGWGLHGFEAQYGQYVGFEYPHNFTVQLAAETGALGLLALLLVIGAAVRALRRLPLREPSVVAFLAGTAIIAVASQFSGDYYDTRMLWAYLLIATAAIPSDEEAPATLAGPVTGQRRTGLAVRRAAPPVSSTSRIGPVRRTDPPPIDMRPGELA